MLLEWQGRKIFLLMLFAHFLTTTTLPPGDVTAGQLLIQQALGNHFLPDRHAPIPLLPLNADLPVSYQIAVDDSESISQMQGRRTDSSRREAPRLPVIAPRYEAGSSASEPKSGILASGNVLQDTPRSRLPPRSRSGCWTCRTRKVKCDEQRPTCGQCARLGHDCDYNPRLAFRDDTARVIERIQDVTTAGSSVWDPHLPTPSYGQDRSGEDILPTFSALTTDEDRERKAELQEPGTYLVVANPRSFASLPEYCEDSSPYASAVLTPAGSDTRLYDGSTNNTDGLNDPNIIILEKFEDPLRRSPALHIPNLGPLSAVATSQALMALDATGESVHLSSYGGLSLSKLDLARNGGRDAYLLQHYRSNISSHVIKVGSQAVEEDAFEIEARTFPPLFHAMMAISALSLAHRNGTQSADALEHYQKVLPAMRDFVQSESDSISDGAFFTHYLLLLYEIASAGPWESNMWQSHCRTLLQIVARRHQVNRAEPHGFLVWIIGLVDTYALLCGSGNGDFVDFILKDNVVAAQECLPPLAPGLSQAFFPEELPYFPTVLDLNQHVVRLAVKVGETARDMRAEDARRQLEGPGALGLDHAYFANRKRLVHEIQALCHNSPSAWEARYPQYWPWQPAAKSLPYRVRGFYDHIYTLYRACVIYSYTSMYPGQMAEVPMDIEAETDIPVLVTEIIELAQQVVVEERWEMQCISFSLFLAGVVSKNNDEKMLALSLMTAFERQGYGGNTATIRRLLKAIYDKQQSTPRNGEQNLEIDWVEEMRMNGLRLVMFGM